MMPPVLTPTYWATAGLVYAVRATTSGLVKIGFTRNLEKRMRSLASVKRDVLVVLAAYAGPRRLEAELHEMFRPFARGREWFALGDEHIGFLSALPSVVEPHRVALEHRPLRGCTARHS